MIRKTIFWAHLISGVLTGLVILMMSVTGVVLTYERQMLDWADSRTYDLSTETAERQDIAALVAGARAQAPDFSPTAISFPANSNHAVVLSAGRSGSLYVDPYSGELLGAGANGWHSFFGAVTGWHRWFNASGEDRGFWRAITGVSNLAFLFLLISGAYLWLPRVYKWAAFRSRLLFNAKATTSKARDFNWHHVFGIWSTLPLIIVIATATVFSYSWSNNLLYRAFGEDPPGRGPPPAVTANSEFPRSPTASSQAPRTLDELTEIAAAYVSNWQTLTLNLPAENAATVSFTIDQGNGGQPQRRHTLKLDAVSGQLAAWEPFGIQSPARQARSWVRFLHTGEALGIIGQTIAGLVSLTSVLMVWTGLALAYRRLIVPLFKRKGSA